MKMMYVSIYLFYYQLENTLIHLRQGNSALFHRNYSRFLVYLMFPKLMTIDLKHKNIVNLRKQSYFFGNKHVVLFKSKSDRFDPVKLPWYRCIRFSPVNGQVCASK